MSEMTEVERLRTALEKIAATHDQNRWHPNTNHPTEASRHWHDGYISCAASHALIANAALNPEQAAEDDRVMRIGAQGTDSEWFEATGHCGRCAIVASSCECDGECGCWEEHGPPLKPWGGVLQDRYDAGFLDGLAAAGGALPVDAAPPSSPAGTGEADGGAG